MRKVKSYFSYANCSMRNHLPTLFFMTVTENKNKGVYPITSKIGQFIREEKSKDSSISS